MRDTQSEREAETQAEGEADSKQGARCWTQSLVPRIRPWAEGSAKLLSRPGCPKKKLKIGQPGWLSGLAPPSAQGVILETQDPVPRWAPCVGPASPSACVSAPLSLSLSLYVCHE